jgi:ketosteroid isomerase-like protein
MSQENVEAFYRAVEAYERRDLEALLKTCDTEIEWRPSAPALEPVYSGAEGIAQLFRDADRAYSDFSIDFDEVSDLGDRVFAIGRIRVRDRASGTQVDSPLGSIAEMRGGKAFRVRNFLDPEEALRAARPMPDSD